MSTTAPKSYLNEQRPPLLEAMTLEEGTIAEATESLKSKGYFTPRPRPWKLGFKNRGMGRGDFAILDRFDDLVTANISKEDAELIIGLVNERTPYPPIAHHTRVRTTKPNLSKESEWIEEGWNSKKWGVHGIVTAHHDSHGLYYDVRHDDGTRAPYDPSELEVVE